jgi:hypothetical protein
MLTEKTSVFLELKFAAWLQEVSPQKKSSVEDNILIGKKYQNLYPFLGLNLSIIIKIRCNR